jgi:hypothetical protein
MNTRSLFLTAAIMLACVSPVAAAEPKDLGLCPTLPGFHQWVIITHNWWYQLL